jgi:hypothetical protein
MADTARVLMLCGAVTIVGSLTTGSAAQAFVLGLFLWLLGACLLAFVPVAAGRRFPRAAAAAVAEAVLKHFFVTP